MSLFYTPREVRIINTKKRKKDDLSSDEVQEMYSCNWCADEYDSETELHVHKKVKHRQNVAKMLSEDTVCKMCISRREDQEDLLKHIKSTHLLSCEDAEHVHREIFICDICNRFYFNKDMIALHMQQVHDPEHRFRLSGTCPKCHKDIQIRHVWFHFQRHSIQSVACCPICFKKCKNQSDLQEHVKKHASYYHCSICGYDTRVKESFNAHMQTHNCNLEYIGIDESLVWKCFAPKKMKSRSDVYFGTKGLKLNGVFVCVLCRGVCKEDEMAAHIANYHLANIVATKKLYMCVCGEQFFNNVLLKHHVFKLQGDHKACD